MSIYFLTVFNIKRLTANTDKVGPNFILMCILHHVCDQHLQYINLFFVAYQAKHDIQRLYNGLAAAQATGNGKKRSK